MTREYRFIRRLRSYKGKHGQQVFIRVRMKNGSETEVPVYDYVNYEKVPILVEKHHWEKGRITGGRYHISLSEVNMLLYKVEYNIGDAIRELQSKNIKINQKDLVRLTYKNEIERFEREKAIEEGDIIVDEDGGPFGSEDDFIEFVQRSSDPKFDDLKKEMGFYVNEFILDYWEAFIKNYAPDSYNSSYKAVKNYIDKTGDNCKANEYSATWLERFFEYLLENGYHLKKDSSDEAKPYYISTLNKFLKHLNSFGDYLHESNIIDNQDYVKFKLRKDKKKKSLVEYPPDPFANTHALYKKEMDYFFYYNFDDEKLALARDMFILQTWLGGLRQSDFYSITSRNVHKDPNGNYKIWFEQRKTDGEVQNVVNEYYVIPILAKRSGNLDGFLPVYQYNKFLKEAAKIAGLNRELKFRLEIAKDKKPTQAWHPIHTKISNNWARNCAVSILAELGFSDGQIAMFTGHRDTKMIKHYKQIHTKDVKSMLDMVKPEKTEKLDL